MLWTKQWNSCLLKPSSPENTVRLSHKSGNKNNVKEEFICLIFSNVYSYIFYLSYFFQHKLKITFKALLTKVTCLK